MKWLHSVLVAHSPRKHIRIRTGRVVVVVVELGYSVMLTWEKEKSKIYSKKIYIEDTSTLLCSETKLADWSRDRINPIELIGNGRPRYRSRFGEWHTNRARVYNLAKCRRCLSPPTWKLFNETNCNFPFLWKGGKALPSARIIKKMTTI